MKIAIEFKDEATKEKILHQLRDWEVSYSSLGSVWIYNLKVVHNYGGKNITLERILDFKTFKISLEDIEYFEVHNNND